MALRFDENGKLYDDAPAPAAVGMPAPREESGFLRRTVGDAATALTKGALVGLPQAALGLTNFATGGLLEGPISAAGDALKSVGERIDKKYSTQHQEQAQEVAQTKGFLPTIGAYISRPGYLVDTALEQVPGMIAGGLAGRAAVGGKAALSGMTAEAATAAATRGAAIGEGLVAAGQNIEQIRDEAGGETTFGQRALGAASGAITGGIAFGAGKFASKMGIADADVLLAGGRAGTGEVAMEGGKAVFKQAPGLASRVGRGILSEGVLEELPQSVQEQVLQNVALGNPAMQGVPEAAGAGLVLGGAMGGTVAGTMHNSKLADGIAAIEYLSQPMVDEAGNPAVDEKMAGEALRALSALHPPASAERQSMDEWRLEQMARLSRGEGVDWEQFGAIRTNQQLVDLAQSVVSDVAARRGAYEEAKQTAAAIANGQLPEMVMDDQGNLVARPPMAAAAPTAEETARAARMQQALAAGDMETLARMTGTLVRPTPETPAAATAPAPTPAAPAQPTTMAPLTPEMVRKTAGKGVTSNAAKVITELVTAGKFQDAANEVSNLVMAAADPKNKATDATREAIGKLEAIVSAYANQAGTQITFPHHAPQGATNVQTTPVDAGAGPGAAAGQTDAAVPVAGQKPAPEGDAAGQSVEKAAKAEVAPTQEKADEGQKPAAAGRVEGGQAAPAVEGQPVRQEGAPAASEKGNAAPVQQEVKAEPKPRGRPAGAPQTQEQKNAKRRAAAEQKKVAKEVSDRADTVVANVNTLALDPEAGGVEDRDAYISSLFTDANSLLTNAALSEPQKQALKGAVATLQRLGKDGASRREKATAAVRRAATRLRTAEDALAAADRKNTPRAERAPYVRAVALARAELEQANRTLAEGGRPIQQVEAKGRRRRSNLSEAEQAAIELFEFEIFDYDPKAGHATGSNFLWVASAMEAIAVAYPTKEPTDPVGVARMENARDALKWLVDTNPSEDMFKLIADRNAQMEKTLALTEKMRARMEEGLAKMKRQITRELIAEALKIGEHEVTDDLLSKRQLSDKQQAEIAEAMVTELGRITSQLGGTTYDAVTAYAGTTNPALKAALQEVSGTNGVAQVLTAIQMLTSSDGLRVLAQSLQSIGMDGVKIEYRDAVMRGVGANGMQGYKRGNYNRDTNTVTIYAGGENPQIVLHELVHAATVARLARAQEMLGRATNQQDAMLVKGYRQLTELYAYLSEHPDLQGEYAFKNIYEFVAEVHSNPKLQAKLKAIDAPAGLFGQMAQRLGSLLHAYVEALRNVLGLRPGAKDALSRAIDASSPFFAANEGATPSKAGAESFDAVATPLTALPAVSARAKQYFSAMDTSLGKQAWTQLKAKARKALLYVMSSEAIYHSLKHDEVLKPIRESFEKFFGAERIKTTVRKMVSDLAYEGFAREVQLALAKAKNPERANRTLAWLAGEASRFNLDLRKDFAGNKAALGKALDDSLKDHVDRLHREYLRLDPALAKLLKRGELVNRQMYAMQMASLVRGVIRAHQKAGGVQAAADDVAKKFWNRLDILQSTKGKANPDPGVHFDALGAELHAALEDLFAYVEATYPMSDLHEDMKTIMQAYRKGWGSPYMHLGRHGMYRVKFSVADPSPETVAKLDKLLSKYGAAVGPFEKGHTSVFLRVENAYTADEILRTLKAEPGLLAKDSDGKPAASAGMISDAAALENAFGTGKVLKELRSRMAAKFKDLSTGGPQMQQAYAQVMVSLTDTLLDMLEVNSARHANQKRDNVPGYSLDYLRSFAKRAQWGEASIANTYTADLYTEAFLDMQHKIDERGKSSAFEHERGQEVHDELAKRYANSLKPVDAPLVHKLSVFGNNFYLALSPAYAIGNLLQPYMLTLPYLGGRFGFTKSAKVMAKSSRDVALILKQTLGTGWSQGGWRGVLDAKVDLKGSSLTQRELEFVLHLLKSGIVDATQAHELGRLADGDTSGAAMVAKAASLFNHYTEVANRLSAGLAAYRLASSMEEQRRQAYAIETVGMTQFNYTDQNTARAIGRHGFMGAATPLFMQFQRFAFFTMEHYARMVNEGFIANSVDPKDRAAARKALGGTLAAAALLAGTMGLPFVTTLVALANAFRGDDDDKDLRALYREWLADVFGADAAELIAKGVLSRGVLGVDMTGSLGQQDLIPGSRFAADRRNWEDKIKDQSKTMFGPALNAGFDIYGGLQHIKDGDIAEGLKAVLPRALKPIATIRATAAEGAFVDKSGRTLPMNVTWADYAKMAAGFTPAKKAEQSEANFYYQSELTQAKLDKADARKQAVKAIESGDYAEANSILADYASAHPGDALTGLSSVLAARARGRAIAAIDGAGIIETNTNNFPKLAAYGDWANTDD